MYIDPETYRKEKQEIETNKDSQKKHQYKKSDVLPVFLIFNLVLV